MIETCHLKNGVISSKQSQINFRRSHRKYQHNHRVKLINKNVLQEIFFSNQSQMTEQAKFT